MTISDLQIKVSEVLGVSSTEKNLAFEILILKISEILSEDLTLKVPRIGYFQFKKDPGGTQNQDTLIYSPLAQDLEPDARSFFLTIGLPAKGKSQDGIDSNLFSIGVGKPLLPITEEVGARTKSETSYAILKKSIEERVNELLAESDGIPNFNIWDDYYESGGREESGSKLTELTSDLEFKEELMAEDITSNLLNYSDERKELIESAEEILPQEELSPTNLLEDYLPPQLQPEEPEIEIELKSHFDKFNEEYLASREPEEMDELIVPPAGIPSGDFDVDEKKESDGEYSTTSGDKDSFNAEIEEEKPGTKKSLKDSDLGSLLGEINDLVSDATEKYLWLKEQKEKQIEWNWGDELKDELSESYRREKESYQKESYRTPDEEVVKDSKDLFRKTRPISPDLFDKLRQTLRDEMVEGRDDIQFLEYSGPLPNYEFVAPQNTGRTTKPGSSSQTPVMPKTLYDDYNEPPKNFVSNQPLPITNGGRYDLPPEPRERGDKYFSRAFLLIFSAFVIVASIIIYFLVLDRQSQPRVETAAVASADSLQNENIVASLPADSQNVFTEEESDFPRVPSLPVKESTTPASVKKEPAQMPEIKNSRNSSESGLYKTLQTDTRVGKSVYFDGSRYNVQLSSWRNRQKAEQEVVRLKKSGFEAFVTEANLPQKGGIWYRVRIGGFKSREEAESFLVKNSF